MDKPSRGAIATEVEARIERIERNAHGAIYGSVTVLALLLATGLWLAAWLTVRHVVPTTDGWVRVLLVLSSLADAWAMLHAESLTQVGEWAEKAGVAGLWGLVVNSLLAWPGFLVTGIPGLALAFAGRSRTTQISNFGQT